MQRRRNWFWIVFLAMGWLSGCTPVDNDSIAPTSVFVKFYGGSGLDAARDIKHTPNDGGFIILGERGVPGTLDNEILLIKTDSAGNTISEATYQLNPSETGVVYSPARVVLVPGGGYMVAGSRQVSGSTRKIVTLKVGDNLQPDPSWGAGGFREYGKNSYTGTLLSRTPLYSCLDIAVYATGFALIGSTNDVKTDKPFFDALRDNTDIYVLVLDFQGNTIYEQKVGYPGDDIGYSIIPIENSRFAIMGMTTRSAFSTSDTQLEGQNVLFNIIDQNGEASTNKIYGSSSEGGNTSVDDVPVKMIRDGLGFTIMTNDGVANAVVMKLTETGIRTFSSNLVLSQNSNGRDIIRANNGEYIVVGSILTVASDVNQVNRGNDMMILNLGQDLQVNSDRIYNYGGRENDIANGIVQLPSGSLVVVGTTDFENGNTMITLLKTNTRGRLIN